MKNETTERALGLSTAQVAGSALAAMSAALIASWAGTTGTIVGAAVGSVVATIGAATYTWSLQRTTDAVRRTAEQVRLTTIPLPLPLPLPRGDQSPQRAGAQRPVEQQAGERHPADAEGPTLATATPVTLEARTRSGSGRSLQWGKVLLASAAVTVAVLGGITSVEALTGRTVSSFTGSGETSGTSLGRLVAAAETPSSTTEPSAPVQDTTSTDDASDEQVSPDPTPAAEPTTGSEAPAPEAEEPADQPSDPVTEPSQDVPASPAEPTATPPATVP